MPIAIDDINVLPVHPETYSITTFTPVVSGGTLNTIDWVITTKEAHENGGQWGGKGLAITISFIMTIESGSLADD